MATLEELRKKRLQELQSRQQSSGVDDSSRQKRIDEIRSKKSTFTERPQEIQDTIDSGSDTSAGEALGRSAAVNTFPMLGGVATGATAVAIAGTLAAGPVGTVLGFIGGSIAGAIITKKAQDEVLEVVKGEDWKRNLDQSIIEDRQNHPYATLIGEAAPALITFRPSPSTLKQAFNISKRALTDKKSLSSHMKTLEGKTELDALINVGVGAGVDVSLETYQQAREGDIDALRIIGSAVLGGTISDPNRLGVKLGFSSTGDAVIEEYNKFGSQTPAAKIITENDIPIIDRSTEGILKDRRELSAILRGEAEQNRFTDPRIIQAEKISGTIDKDVTPESDLNIYRLDGRSGPMRVGERVTANPHIADVFGGRINPEAVVKAGDLVRTSKGDYVFVPKSAIEARPKLPPVSMAADKSVRDQVASRENLQMQQARTRAKEAMRQKEEPARLAKEAEERAEKQRVEAEKKFQKEEEQAQVQRAKLEKSVAEQKADTQKRIKAEKKRVPAEKAQITKKFDKEIESVSDKLRKDLNAAMIQHTTRLEKAKTKMQKTKENIRYGNEKAKLKSQAVKQKKTLRQKASEEKKGVTSRVNEIKAESREAIKELNQKIKSVPKPKLEVADTTPTKSTSKNTQPKQTTTQKPAEPKLVEKRTTIGTKAVKSDSIIKNAVEDARQSLQKAQELDQDVTHQMGTTFVEQRKLSAELLAERGFDDTLRFGIDSSNAEIARMNIDRSALYETLYKTAIREGQFDKYRNQLEDLALIVSDDVSAAAQKSSIHRLATENDPFRRVAKLKKELVDREKELRGSVFSKEVDELYAKIKAAGSKEDIDKIINDNLC